MHLFDGFEKKHFSAGVVIRHEMNERESII